MAYRNKRIQTDMKPSSSLVIWAIPLSACPERDYRVINGDLLMTKQLMNEQVMPEVLALLTTESEPSHMQKKRAAKNKVQAVSDLITSFSPFQASKFLEKDSKPFFVTTHGALFDGDCLAVLPLVRTDSVDTVFADPPFNLDKKYGPKSKDNLPEQQYVAWCKAWLDECIRVLKPGGSLFVYNLPRWNIVLGAYLIEKGLTFRHDITVDVKSTMPIAGRLYPSHYSLLYFSKGKPKTFRKVRTPIEICRHCGGDVKDYGGHRHAMNPLGVNLRDVWADIPPVRHWKFKSKDRPANALSTKLLDRVVEISTVEGDIVLDPFGGSGTTFAVCEKKNRYWIGVELDFAQQIKERLRDDEIAHHKNTDFIEG